MVQTFFWDDEVMKDIEGLKKKIQDWILASHRD